MTDHAIDWISPTEGADAGQALLRLLRAGRDPRPPPRAAGVVGQVQGASFDDGWDALRERTIAKQKELGVIPPEAELTERPDEIPAWDDMPDDLKPVLARQMEVYAGFLEHTDHHIGRLLDSLGELAILENTLVYYIIGDNGASAEGSPTGCFNELVVLNGAVRTRDDGVHGLEDRRLRHAGGLQPLRGRLGARDGHAVPVDEAGRLALGRDAERHDRALAERDQGEGRDPLAVPPRDRRRPDRARGGGLPAPLSVNGVQQRPLEGVSMALHVRRRRRRPTATRRSTSRCSATAASTTKAGRR